MFIVFSLSMKFDWTLQGHQQLQAPDDKHNYGAWRDLWEAHRDLVSGLDKDLQGIKFST
jgi:hypothetical protein